MSAANEFGQLRLKFTDPIQHDYEVIRPIVLHAESIAERSRQTDIGRTVVGDKARRFVQHGMLGLVDQRAGKAGRKAHQYPDAVAGHILYLKQLYPPIHYREIVRIVARKFGYKTNHVTVKKFLERHPIPVQLAFEFKQFRQFEDAYQARWTVVQMWAQGWNKKSIAGCLKVSRTHVHELIAAFEHDGFRGLEEQRHRPPDHPANQMTLPFLKEVLDIQKEYPRAGKFRVRGLLEKQYRQTNRAEQLPSERTISRAMAHNRAHHDAPAPWHSHQDELKPEAVPKHLPYRPAYRHHIWYLDIRYLVKLEGQWIYSICVLEGYSRAILAGAASAYQDLTAVLQILYAALADYGCPDVIVSDNAAVFKANDYRHILETLAIDPKYIEKGKPWQNLIEPQFKIQLRLADVNFEQAQTLDAVQNHHAAFVDTFNTTTHYAHQARPQGQQTPMAVLAWVRGRSVTPETLQRLFRRLQFVRTVNRFGFVSIQRFYIYAEQGLARQRVSIWIFDGQLQIDYQNTRLAHYQADLDRSQKRLQTVSQPTLYQTPFASPQLILFDLDDEQWLKVRQRSYDRHPQASLPGVIQLSLFPPDTALPNSA